MKLLCSRIPTSDWSLDNPCPATYVDIDGNCCKKLSISAGDDREKLRRLSRMRYHDMRRSLGLTSAAFSRCMTDLPFDASQNRFAEKDYLEKLCHLNE
jgi:hypothetical protein